MSTTTTTACRATVTVDDVADLPQLVDRLAGHGCPVPAECAAHAAWKLEEEA